MENHVYPSKIFELFQQLTASKVQFTAFQANLSEAAIEMSGKAISYDVLAEQMVAFQNDERIISLDTSNIRTDVDGQVIFQMEIILDQRYLKYQIP